MANASSSSEYSRRLHNHLKSWGLKQFQDEAAYYQWQKNVLSGSDLSFLNQLAQQRLNQEDPSMDIRFYDVVATPKILPVLYSQRYDFYCVIGVAIAERLTRAKQVLDFGCGVGILTTFWATMFPEVEFVGIDRSTQSVVVATEQAAQRQLQNVRFEYAHVPGDEIVGVYDCVISTQVLFQAEDDPGLCSVDWRTFERSDDASLQQQAEASTGVGLRLNALCLALSETGTILLCEKTQHLGRRILLQRALARRGFLNRVEPVALIYDSLDEHIEEGPLYEVTRESVARPIHWDENPAWHEGMSLYPCSGAAAYQISSALSIVQPSSISVIQGGGEGSLCHLQFGTWCRALTYGSLSTRRGFCGLILGSVRDEALIVQSLTRFKTMSEQDIQVSIQHIWGPKEDRVCQESIPCYENHSSAAQAIWQSLPDRSIQEEETFRELNGRAMHIELGNSGPFKYVYWANTFDQRQLVMAVALEADWLVKYYRESLAEMQTSLHR